MTYIYDATKHALTLSDGTPIARFDDIDTRKIYEIVDTLNHEDEPEQDKCPMCGFMP